MNVLCIHACMRVYVLARMRACMLEQNSAFQFLTTVSVSLIIIDAVKSHIILLCDVTYDAHCLLLMAV